MSLGLEIVQEIAHEMNIHDESVGIYPPDSLDEEIVNDLLDGFDDEIAVLQLDGDRVVLEVDGEKFVISQEFQPNNFKQSWVARTYVT